jgi:hypothetical protein
MAAAAKGCRCGWLFEAAMARRQSGEPQGSLTLQTEDVLADARGFIYITRTNQGLWILRFTGDGPIEGLPQSDRGSRDLLRAQACRRSR